MLDKKQQSNTSSFQIVSPKYLYINSHLSFEC